MKTVAINIGHSATQYGAEDPIQPAEGDLRYTREVIDNALLAGFLLREMQNDPDLQPMLIMQQGAETLASLAKRINDLEPDVIVSLHRNSVLDPRARGYSLWHHGTSAPGKRLAEAIQNLMKDMVVIDPDPAGAVRSDFERFPGEGFAILRLTKAPAIIFEGGFISNPRDECWYDDPACLFAMAFALRKGVSDYLAS